MGLAHFFHWLKWIAETRDVTPDRRGQNKEANGGGADIAPLSNERAGSFPENRDRSEQLESPWCGIAKA